MFSWSHLLRQTLGAERFKVGVSHVGHQQWFPPPHNHKIPVWNLDADSFYSLPNFSTALSLHFLQSLELFMERTVTSVTLKAITMSYSPLWAQCLPR